VGLGHQPRGIRVVDELPDLRTLERFEDLATILDLRGRGDAKVLRHPLWEAVVNERGAHAEMSAPDA